MRAALLPTLMLGWPAAAVAQAPPPEELLTRHREEIRRVIEVDCAPRDENNVVVCGRRPRLVGGGERVPYQAEAGARVRLVEGEAPGGMAAMSADGCMRLCDRPVMIDLIGGDRSFVNALGRGINRLLGRD